MVSRGDGTVQKRNPRCSVILSGGWGQGFLVSTDGKPMEGFMVVNGLFSFAVRRGLGLGAASAQRGSALNQGSSLSPYSEKHFGG